MMGLYAPKRICTDATHGTTGYDFKLISYLVVDDLDEGFPVAWCISNREDYVALKVFNKVIKDNNDGKIKVLQIFTFIFFFIYYIEGGVLILNSIILCFYQFENTVWIEPKFLTIK